jgi:hypothetical protein
MITQDVAERWNQRDPSADYVLPPSLDEMARGTPLAAHISDPVTGLRYEYKPGEGTHYALCAVFEEPTPSEMWMAANWRHRRGRTCFQFNAMGPSYYQGR